MRIEILIRKYIIASNIQKAMSIIKEKYPYARLITYKFCKDMRYQEVKDYKNRKINVAFVEDFRKIKEEL